MSLLSLLRNYFYPEPEDDSLDASQAVIEESKQARVQMNEQTKQAQHEAFQFSVEQQQIRTRILNQGIARKSGSDFLDDALTNQEGRPWTPHK